MSGGVKAVLGEVLPCAAMVVVEGCIIALTIMASTAMAKGMSPFVFVVYTNALGSISLLPYSFRNRITMAQNLAFVGLSYSSPIVAISMANQIPALSFILAIILRTTKFDWKSSGSRARLIGTLISFMGAISVTLYKGPTIRNHSSPSLAFPAAAPPPRLWGLSKCVIVFFYSLFGTIQSAVLALFLERDPMAWRLELNFELLIIILTAIFSSLIRSNVQIWCTRLKGPIFVPIFKPFGIAYASTFGCLLFADTFHYGSMMAAFVCGVGYYTVLWGQIKDEEKQKLIGNNIISSTEENKVPLLQDQDSQIGFPIPLSTSSSTIPVH
ncbi:hypothetical protein DH2020_027012 [Rehmannia glutinosa]|uniref:WAT1-related protein n=1 Tax=Rehmannia glutinosa TaxID=99300 RepID=A0ABR0VX34_REHGL